MSCHNVQTEDQASSVPSDIYAYLEKIDKDDEDTEDQVTG